MKKIFIFLFLLLTFLNLFAQETDSIFDLYMTAETENGEIQSPINIPSFSAKDKNINIDRDYLISKLNITFHNKLVQINYDFGSSIVLENKLFDVKFILFKTPAEHLISSVTYPLEMQIYHLARTTGGEQKIIVLSVLFKEGSTNNMLQNIVDNIPNSGEIYSSDNVIFDLDEFFKSENSFYFYEGSRTNLPYSENVYWIVLTEILEASYAQIKQLNTLQKNNARHIQALNGREIFISSGL
jgi:carbonic anhydrase